MIGQVVSHYRVLTDLGRGGMGHVYKAEDLKLGRLVALKFLSADLARDEQALSRFAREARAASALNHPNICTVYEIDDAGPAFIAMELLEGTTLRQQIRTHVCSVDRILSVGLQVADALDAVHAKGITHRDLKPENIFIDARDRVKLLDFGLAKVARSDESDASDTILVTSTGTVHGTAAYMSPEQARGEEVDGRSDLYALGAVLYEMSTGVRPFGAANSAVLFDAILNRPPKPPGELRRDLPKGLQAVICRLLEKSPNDRYQTAAALLQDLKRLLLDAAADVPDLTRSARRGAVGGARRQRYAAVATALIGAAIVGAVALRPIVGGSRRLASVAVIPFADADASAQYVSDGVSTAIMNSLSQLSDLRVVPRALVTRYRSDAADLKQVARELDVPVLLTGRIKQDGDSLVVEAELTDTAAQSQLWGQRFDRSAADLVAIQEEITVAVAEHLSRRLTAEDRRKLVKRATSNPEAYKLYLQGHSFWDQWTEASIAASLDYYRQATQKDPTYALAYAGLANSYIALSFLNSPPRVSMPLAKDNVTKALALDDAVPEAHYLLGVVNLYFDWDRAAAERQFQRALALNPRYAAAHYAVGNALVVAGRLEDARAEIEQSVQLDPFSNTWNEQLVVFYSGLGELDRAEDQARKSILRDPTSFWLHLDLAMIMVRRGKAAEALSEFEQADRISGGNPYAIGYLGFGQARAGRRAAALNTLDRLDALTATRYVPSFTRALVHAGLGDTERSFADLQQAREERECWLLWYFILDGAFDGLKSDPRYAKLLEPLRVSAS